MKYEEIISYIKKEAALGTYKPGEQLPSVRELSKRFECAKATVMRAYNELKEEDIVYAVPGSGYYLIVKSTEKKEQNQNVIDFSGTELDRKILPYNDFHSCLNQAVYKYQENLFAYTNPQGLTSLINVLREHLQNNQVFTFKENIFVTTGSQQTLNILSHMPFPNGKDNVVIEQPTYQGMVQALKLNKIRTIGVIRNYEGLNFDSLEKIFRNDNVKFFYTVPRFSNPLGLNYTNDDKKKLLELAGKYDIYIIEDDYLGDFDNDKKSDPLYAFDMSERVIYVKTFSKLLLPGLRVAVVVLPRLLINTFKEYKYWSDINTPVLSQGALEIFIESGLYDLHINKVRKIYRERMAYLKDVSQTITSKAVCWHIPEKGIFYGGLEILNSNKGKKVIENLFKKNIILSKMDKYYLKEFYDDKVLRISVANTDYDTIKEGVSRIIETIENITDFSFMGSVDL